MFKLYAPQFSVVAAIAVLQVFPAVKGESCIVKTYDQVANAISTCTTIIIDSISVPPNTTLNLNLQDGTSLTFQGNTSFQKFEWKGPLVVVSGKNVRVSRDPGSFLDGLGSLYWDGRGDSGVKKPKFFRIRTTDGSIFSDINLLNCPVQCVSINNAKDTTLIRWNIDVSDGDANGGHNTDGFDISGSQNILVQDAIVKNQDDCVAVNQGNDYIFRNLTCIGGHGLSLSVGTTPVSGSASSVRNVTFSDSSISNSRNGIHVKTHTDGGNGSISLITYKNIALSGITNFGINVQEDYKGGNSTGVPVGNIPITGLDLTNVTGSMSSVSSSMGVFILCGDNGCSNWNWSGISISNTRKKDSCNFNPLGYTCKTG